MAIPIFEGVIKSRDEIKHAKFVLLYEFGKESDGVFKAYRVKNIGELSKEQISESYPEGRPIYMNGFELIKFRK